MTGNHKSGTLSLEILQPPSHILAKTENLWRKFCQKNTEKSSGPIFNVISNWLPVVCNSKTYKTLVNNGERMIISTFEAVKNNNDYSMVKS